MQPIKVPWNRIGLFFGSQKEAGHLLPNDAKVPAAPDRQVDFGVVLLEHLLVV